MRPDLFAEQLRLFPGGEMAAPGDLVEVDDVGVALLDPAARGPPDLTRKGGEADRDRRRRRSLAGRKSLGSSALPVRPGRRGPVPVNQYSEMLSRPWSRVPRRVWSCTPCDRSATSSLCGQRVASIRSRKSISWSSGIST